MGISGNSNVGKSYSSFTVSPELLEKVCEAVKSGEKSARSSGDIQSFEIFCLGLRANISLGRVYIVPAKVCTDRQNFPTALLHGAIVRVFGTGGEEVADLIEHKIGTGEFDEFSQLDFDTLKEKLFVDPQTGKEACLIVFAPNWSNSREFICFHYTTDDNQLKNNLRHQIFSAYFDPRLSSAFNAITTNLNTSKIDVTNVTPKMNFPFLAENLLKEYPSLEKQAGVKKPTILLNRKTADAITKETLDPQELDVFDSLNQALENTLLPDAEGAMGEEGFKTPTDTKEVPRIAAKSAGDLLKMPESVGRNSLGQRPGETPEIFLSPEEKGLANQTVAPKNRICPECEHPLPHPAPYGCEVERGDAPGGEGDKGPYGSYALPPCGCMYGTQKQSSVKEGKAADEKPMAAHETPFTNVGPGTGAAEKQKNMVPAIKDSLEHAKKVNKDKATAPIGIAIDETGVPRREGDKQPKQAKKIKINDQIFEKSAVDKWGNAKVPVNFDGKMAREEFISEHIAAEIEDTYDASSIKAKSAHVRKESLLDKFRDKKAVALDIDSIWDEITEDMGPAPLVDIDTDASNPEPSNTDGEERKSTRPNKRDIGDLPEAFRSDEPEDDKSLSDSEAESQEDSTPEAKEDTSETDKNSSEEKWHTSAHMADFVSDIYSDVNNKVSDPTNFKDDFFQEMPEDAPEGAYTSPEGEDDMERARRGSAEGEEEEEQKPNPLATGVSTALEAIPEALELLASKKQADIADNEHDIDAVTKPSTKEKGQSPIKGAANESTPNADFGITEEMADQMIASIRPGDRVTILVPAGQGRNGQEWAERTGRAVIISLGHVALNMGGQHGTPGVATAGNIISVRKARKQADTADNPYNMENDGAGAPDNKKVVQKKDTSGPTPVNTKQAADVSKDFSEAKSKTVSPDTVDEDINQPTVEVKNATDINGDISEAKAELDYDKSDMADNYEAKDTVNPSHFASKVRLKCNECGKRFSVSPNATDPECPKCHGVDWDIDVDDVKKTTPKFYSEAAAGDEFPEEIPMDLGAGDLTGIVMTEEEAE